MPTFETPEFYAAQIIELNAQLVVLEKQFDEEEDFSKAEPIGNQISDLRKIITEHKRNKFLAEKEIARIAKEKKAEEERLEALHLSPVLKERFKSFNAMFDEIHKAQSTWVVSDEQLQSELRISIANMVIPAYRSFLGRYSQTFTPGRQTEKYVKYQAEDIETYIDELFDGSAAPAGRKWT